MEKKMKKTITIILMALLLSNPILINEEKNEENEEIDESCAGLIATGSVVKDGRSIFWKNRHSTSSIENKVWFEEGTNYDYIRITDKIGCWMGTNEDGLSIGNFRIDNDEGDLDNGQDAPGPNNVNSSDAMSYVLGTYNTVSDTVDYLIHYATGDTEGTQFIITSSEPNVSAIVAMDPQTTKQYNITWINNSWAALDNGFYCDDDNDPDENRDRVEEIINDIRNNGTSSDNDNLINWKDVIQRCAKDVSDKEEGTGTFSLVDEISKGDAVSALVTISGKNSSGNSSHMSWLSLGRQPIINVFFPLAVSTLESQDDIPYKLWTADGFEKFVNFKKDYCDAGSNQFYCDRVREVLSYANSNENASFQAFDELDLIGNETEIKRKLDSYGDMTNQMLWNYEHNRTWSTLLTNHSDFDWYKKITISASNIDSDLNYFPVLINHTDSDLTNKVQEDGSDFVFFNAVGDRLNHELIEYNNSTGNIIAYVNIPFINSSSDTEFYMYYGNEQCGFQDNVTGVWDDDYVLVHHYEDTILHDSSKYGHIGNDTEGTASKQQTGKVSDCVGVSESTDTTIKIFDWGDPNKFTDEFTAEMWLYIDSSTTESYPRIFTEGPGYSVSDWCYYLRPGNSNNEFRVTIDGSTVETEGNMPSDDAWWFTALRFSDSDNDLDVHADLNEELSYAYGSSIGDSYTELAIGNDGGGDNTWNGYIDEVRVSKIKRSLHWINATFNSINNPNFLQISERFKVNETPFLSNPSPANQSENIPLNLSSWSIEIKDNDSDMMNWTIETKPDVGSNNGNNEGNGTKKISLTTLENSTRYTVYVNVTDGVNPVVTEIFTFKTGASEIWVDDNALPGWYDATHLDNLPDAIDTIVNNGTITVYNGTYTLTDELYIDRPMNILGESREQAIIQRTGGNEHRLLTIEDIKKNYVTIDNFTFQGGYANMTNRNGIGGNILVINSLNATINNSIIKDGFAEQYGGGVQLESGGQLKNSTIYDCDALNSGMNGGGGVSMRYGGNIVENCFITNNTAPVGGGILIKMGANPPNQNQIIHCTIANNTAHGYIGTYYGGGTASQGSGWTTSEIYDSIIYHNSPNNIMDVDGSLNVYYTCTTPSWSGSGSNNNVVDPTFLYDGEYYEYSYYSFTDTSSCWENASDSLNRGAWQKPNQAPVISDENPADGEEDIICTVQHWMVNITDPDNDLINWTIECSNGQQNSSTNQEGGIKKLLLSGLKGSTTYTIYVNATDSEEWTNKTFTFTTVDAVMDININVTEWNPGCNIGEHSKTSDNWAMITNDGNIDVEVLIEVSNSTDWIASTSNAHNQFNVSYFLNSWNEITWEQRKMMNYLGVDEFETFGLQLFMPTSSSTAMNQNITITFTVIPY